MIWFVVSFFNAIIIAFTSSIRYPTMEYIPIGNHFLPKHHSHPIETHRARYKLSNILFKKYEICVIHIQTYKHLAFVYVKELKCVFVFKLLFGLNHY